MAERPVRRRLAAILAADVVGYARLIGADETRTLAALRDVWRDRFNPLVAAHRGRVVKTMGDGALVEFASAVDAVECAVAIQQAMAGLPSDTEPIAFRIGVSLGDIVVEGDDIFGDGVNVAARLEAQAPKGGVLISDAVQAQVQGKVKCAFVDAGALRLKNIAAPVRVWRWGGEDALRRTLAQPGRPGDIPSIAVMPFTNLSGDPEQEFFADGLAEDIITTLSKLAGLRVIARNSSFVYKGRTVDIRDAARQLGVRYVLQGSIRKSGARIRITAQLIDGEDGAHLWAERYDRSIQDIFAVQDEITLILATELQVRLTEGEQARLHYTTTTNVAAWTHWVQGLFHFRQAVTKEHIGRALPHWEKALALDPHSASLNAMLGLMHYLDARFGWWDDRNTAIAKARSYADRALDIDCQNADACTTASLVLLLQGRFDAAADHARRAVRLAPGSADAATLACFVLASSGFPDEGVVQSERAIALSPHYPAYYLGHLGNAYRLAGRIEEAIAAFTAYDARSPGFGLADLVIMYQQNGRSEEARRAAQRLLALRRDFTVASWLRTQFRRDAAQLEADGAALRAAGLPADR